MIGYTAILVLCAFTLSQVTSYEYQKCAKEWIKQGCRINLHYDLVPLFDDRKPDAAVKINWDDMSGYVYDLACRCRQKALEKGYEWFALQNYGICLSGGGKYEDYAKTHPLDVQDRCVGVVKLNKTFVSAVDGEVCVGGLYIAYFYQITKSGVKAASAPQAAEEVAAEEQAVKCTYKSDVILVIDVSGSIGKDNFKYVQAFFLKFLDRYDFQSGNSRLGIIRFDEKCYVDLLWIDSVGLTIEQLRATILKMIYTAGSTLTDNALKCARDKIILPFKKTGVAMNIFVMTDGKSWNGENLLPPIAQQLRDPKGLNCKIIALGVGSAVDSNELVTITGDATQVFMMNDFKNLIDYAAKHLNDIIKKACAP